MKHYYCVSTSSVLVCNFHFSIEFITRENWHLLVTIVTALRLSAVPTVRRIIWSFPLSRPCELRTSSSGSPTTGWWTPWGWGWARPWGLPPPSREETWTTGAVSWASTCSLSTLPWRDSNNSNSNINTYEGAAEMCTGYYCKGADHAILHWWITPCHFDETLGRSEILQSIFIHKFPSIFTEKLRRIM